MSEDKSNAILSPPLATVYLFFPVNIREVNMSLQALHFTLQVHGQEADTFTVADFGRKMADLKAHSRFLKL